MAEITPGEFNGMACLWLDNGQVRLAVTTDRGPRIVFWGRQAGENLLAELPDAVSEGPDGTTLHFLGGHRLWYAPEVRSRTYWPDDDPLQVNRSPDGASFAAPADGAGIVKQIAVDLAPGGPEVRVTHALRNAGRWTVELAPWAISMCRPGGVAMLPQPREQVDPDGFLPNRLFSFWPYSDTTDRRLYLGNRMALVRAQPGPNNKIGYRNVHGWFAYWLDGTLFSKHFDPRLDGRHPDQGCNAEFFFTDPLIELETLGPLVHLDPGSEVTHVETWRLHDAPSPVTTEADAISLADALRL
jgi:hypothetical protein